MEIINLLSEHLEMLSTKNVGLIDIENVQHCYRLHQDIYSHLRNDIFDSQTSGKELCITPVVEIGTDELKRRVDIINNEIEGRFSKALHKMSEFVDVSTIASDLCITIGNNTTNAIVTWHNSSTLFLFAEKIDLESFDILAMHEITHLIQRKTYSGVEEILLIDLMFSEGVACYFSKVINPGFLDYEYISFRNDIPISSLVEYVMGKYDEIEKDLNSHDSEVLMKYISASKSTADWVPRIAYFIGFSVVEKMALKMTNEEILNLSLTESRTEFINTFKHLFNT